MPKDFSVQTFPIDLDRVGMYLEDAAERVPITCRTAALSKVINGPIPYTL